MKNPHVLFLLVSILLSVMSGCAGDTTAKSVNASSYVSSDTVQTGIKPDSVQPRNITFAFVGDIMMGTNYPETPAGAYLPSSDGAKLFTDAIALLREADVAAGNLEGTLLDSGGTPKKCANPSQCYAFRTPVAYVKNLVDAGFDFLSIANNHVNDFGPVGTASTRKALTDAGIAHAGLTAVPTASIERAGRRIGFAAFSPSRGTLSIHDMTLLRNTIAELRRNNDLVVISFHGGAEGAKYTHVPHGPETAFGENRGNVEKFAHAAIDAGADIVYGHGPHVARAAELYKDHLILYSLGNFCTPYRVNVSGISGYAPLVTVEITPDGKFVSGRIHSFIQQKGIGPRTDSTNAVARQISTLSKSDFPSSPLRIAADGTLTR